MNAQIRLNLRGDGGKGVVGGRGGHDDEVDVGARQTGVDERRLRGPGGELRSRLAGRGDMALANAGALLDPFVRRVDHRFEFGVGQHAFGQIGADAAHDRTKDGSVHGIG